MRYTKCAQPYMHNHLNRIPEGKKRFQIKFLVFCYSGYTYFSCSAPWTGNNKQAKTNTFTFILSKSAKNFKRQERNFQLKNQFSFGFWLIFIGCAQYMSRNGKWRYNKESRFFRLLLAIVTKTQLNWQNSMEYWRYSMCRFIEICYYFFFGHCIFRVYN